MRTAKLLKLTSWGVLAAGLGLAGEAWSVRPAVAVAWVVVGLTGTIGLRLLANVGQIVYEQRAEVQRALRNVERQVCQVGAWVKELRDLAKERNRFSRVHEKERAIP